MRIPDEIETTPIGGRKVRIEAGAPWLFPEVRRRIAKEDTDRRFEELVRDPEKWAKFRNFMMADAVSDDELEPYN